MFEKSIIYKIFARPGTWHICNPPCPFPVFWNSNNKKPMLYNKTTTPSCHHLHSPQVLLFQRFRRVPPRSSCPHRNRLPTWSFPHSLSSRHPSIWRDPRPAGSLRCGVWWLKIPKENSESLIGAVLCSGETASGKGEYSEETTLLDNPILNSYLPVELSFSRKITKNENCWTDISTSKKQTSFTRWFVHQYGNHIGPYFVHDSIRSSQWLLERNILKATLRKRAFLSKP